MFNTMTTVKGTIKGRTLLLWRGAFALLIALLASGFAGAGTGVAHASTLKVSSQQADATPAVASGALAWTGTNAAHNLNIMAYDNYGSVFGPAHVLTETTPAGSGPSLASWNNNLYIAWRGNDNRLNVGRYNPANPAHLIDKVTLNERSTNAPSIGGQSTRLYLGWRGTDGHLNIITSADGSHFGSKVTFPISIRTSPTLNGTGFGLFVAWEDMSASSHIVIGTYYYAQPHPRNLVAITTTATSELPVSLASSSGRVISVATAWRTTNDAHIHMGIFNWSAVLQNPTILPYTTAYCPALDPGPPMVIWTGTDAARHINSSTWLSV